MKEHLRTLLNDLGGLAALPQLERMTGVPEETLAGALTGDLSRWSTDMVGVLARALGVDGAALWSPEPLPRRPSLRFLRGESWPDFHPEDLGPLLRAVGRAAHLRRFGAGAEARPRALFSPLPVTSPAYRQGYALAQRVRTQLGNETEPIASLHDLAQRDLDILVVHERLKTVRLSAVTVAADDGTAIVLNDACESQVVLHRRSVAHELCHALFDPPTDGMLAVLDAELDREDHTPSEQRARAFAAALLIPEDGLLEVLGMPESQKDLDEAGRTVIRVAKQFGAPATMTANHLVNLGYVAKPLRERLIGQVASTRHTAREPRTDWLAERVGAACREGSLSEGRAREILGLSPHEGLPFDLGA